ncbi:hypothetical protein BGX27_008332 [Mortierella sp. AM989]|nr:hypothetical protein BGX27_008332 [Mortierella sp. AM989]
MVTTDSISITSTISFNDGARGGRKGKEHDQKSWSPTSGSKARFTFGYDDALQEEDILKVLPSSTSTLPTQNNNSPSASSNNNNSNSCFSQQQDGSSSNDQSHLNLPPLPLSSPVRSPRLHSTPSKLHVTVPLKPIAPSSTTPTSFKLPRNNFKRQSFISAIAAVSGDGLPRIIPARSSSRSNKFSGYNKTDQVDARSSGDGGGRGSFGETSHNDNNNIGCVDDYGQQQEDAAAMAQQSSLGSYANTFFTCTSTTCKSYKTQL